MGTHFNDTIRHPKTSDRLPRDTPFVVLVKGTGFRGDPPIIAFYEGNTVNATGIPLFSTDTKALFKVVPTGLDYGRRHTVRCGRASTGTYDIDSQRVRFTASLTALGKDGGVKMIDPLGRIYPDASQQVCADNPFAYGIAPPAKHPIAAATLNGVGYENLSPRDDATYFWCVSFAAVTPNDYPLRIDGTGASATDSFTAHAALGAGYCDD